MAQVALHTVAARETSGASTSSRFKFQANLALLFACELHEGAGDYAVIVEHFDDITIYEPDKEKPLTFVQVKGKLSGSWTINNLTSSDVKKPHPNSIIAKLYSNVTTFKESTAELQFVSNAVFNVKLYDGSKSSVDATVIPAAKLHSSELEKIAKSLAITNPPPRNPDCKDILTLRRVPLDPKDQDTFVIGRLVKLTDKLGINSISHSALYKTLHSDIAAKSAEVALCGSTDELLKKKGLRRKELNDVISVSSKAPRFEDFKALLTTDLASEGLGSLQILRIVSACRTFIAQRSLGRTVENIISERMQRIYSENSVALGQCSTIWETAQLLVDLFSNDEIPRELQLSGALVAISENLDG